MLLVIPTQALIDRSCYTNSAAGLVVGSLAEKSLLAVMNCSAASLLRRCTTRKYGSREHGIFVFWTSGLSLDGLFRKISQGISASRYCTVRREKFWGRCDVRSGRTVLDLCKIRLLRSGIFVCWAVECLLRMRCCSAVRLIRPSACVHSAVTQHFSPG